MEVVIQTYESQPVLEACRRVVAIPQRHLFVAEDASQTVSIWSQAQANPVKLSAHLQLYEVEE
jgi:hypothetical protein